LARKLLLEIAFSSPEREVVAVATIFETEHEARAVAAELNGAAGQKSHVRYDVEQYREKWGIARRSVRTYWGWDEYITLGSRGAMPSGESDAKPKPEVSPKEIEEFRDHCVYIRSVYTLMMRIWRDSDDGERKMMEAISPLFFEDIGKVLNDYMVIAACRVTDPVDAGRGRQNFTAELFTNSFPPESETFKKLAKLRQRMDKLRQKIQPARHKLGAHADRDVIRKGMVLPGGSWEEWDDFWSALADFVRILNEQTFGTPFEIDAVGVLGDAETLLKFLKQGQYFDTLLNGNDPKVRDACLKLALPNS
jgi:hypothetical protein